MEDLELVSSLRSLRRRAGLSQSDLAELVGYLRKRDVSRHELGTAAPSLLVAFSYEVVFGVPAARLFPGIYKTVEKGIEERLGKIERELHQSSGKGRKAHGTARRLEWLGARRNWEPALSDHETSP